MISHKKKCSIKIEDDDEDGEGGGHGQSVPEISDDEDSFNRNEEERSQKDYEEIIKDFPDPFSYVIGFTCTSSGNDMKRSTGVASAIGDKRLNEFLNRDLESSPVPLYSKTYHQGNNRVVSSSMDSRDDEIEVRF